MLVRVISGGRDGVRFHSTLADKLREVGASNREDRTARVRSGPEAEADASGEPFREMYVMPKRKLRAQIQVCGFCLEKPNSGLLVVHKTSVWRVKSASK